MTSTKRHPKPLPLPEWPSPAPRKAVRPVYRRRATVAEAHACVLDECLAQIQLNAQGLLNGDPALRMEHVHQLRVGIRRLRTALRTFDGWVPLPPADLVDGLRRLFASLGACREGDVLASSVAVELARAGAPAASLPPTGSRPDPAGLIRAEETQCLLQAWLAWRQSPAAVVPGPEPAEAGDAAEPPVPSAQAARGRRPTLARLARRRLRRWHARIAHTVATFGELDEPGVHDLRKRIKRQRYAVEFLAPLLDRREVDDYLAILSAAQERMGDFNDLCVARAHYRGAAVQEPATWFALGWLAARIEQARALARPELDRLARADPPGR